MPKKIALFFTLGMSLQKWKETGLYYRETLPYFELAKKGHPILFVTYGDKKDHDFILPENVDVLALGSSFAPLKSLLAPFLHRTKLKSCDVYISNQILGSWLPLLCSKLFKRPFLARAGYDLYEFQLDLGKFWWKKTIVKIFSKLTYRFSDKILLTSDRTANFVSETFQISSQKITVRPNYIDTKLFSPSEEGKTDRIISVCRLDRQKNLDKLIRATHQTGFGLDLVGSGDLEKELKALAQEIGADVRFLGRIPNEDLPKTFSRYKVFALVSDIEGSPKALLEAMSCGLCPVGSDVDGINNIISDKHNGRLCQRTIDSIATTLKETIESSERDKWSQNARHFVEANCSLNQYVDTLEKITEDLI